MESSRTLRGFARSEFTLWIYRRGVSVPFAGVLLLLLASVASLLMSLLE